MSSNFTIRNGMSRSDFTVPNGMSRADVLEGLWSCSWPARFSHDFFIEDVVYKRVEDVWKNKEIIEETIQKNPYVGYFAGRCIKTNMSQYPNINVAQFRNQCEIEMTYEEIFELCINRS